MITFMFSGQGTQRRGMGESLFGEFEELVSAADKILGYSVRELCIEDPRNDLNQTQYAQPALFVVNAMSYLKRLQRRGGAAPDALIGHSLGEFNALLASGVFDFEMGLRLVKQRGLLMSEAGEGAMASIIDVDGDTIQQVLLDHDLAEIDLASFNAPDQIVISGRREDIRRAEAIFLERNNVFIPLNTSGAFHSRYMRAAQDRFDALLAGVSLAAPKITVVSNYTGRPYSPDNVRINLSSQISSPVLWAKGIEYLMNLGEMAFEEIGGNVFLSNLVKRIGTKAAPLSEA
jgi:malonyl CoA-acyl carrier protein transacylase